MRLDDFVCLGRTVPEDSKKYGRRVCMAGYSAELRSLVRVYPLPILNPIKQRSLCVLELGRNHLDSRRESWKLDRERADSGVIQVKEQVSKDKILGWLENHACGSIKTLNAERASLGVIRPQTLSWHFKQAGEVTDASQKMLFEDLDYHFGESATPRLIPYLRFTDDSGSHCLQVREWGAHERLRKEPEKAAELWDCMRLTKPNQQVYLVVGNMCNCRNTWLIISWYMQPKETSLFAEAEAEALQS